MYFLHKVTDQLASLASFLNHMSIGNGTELNLAIGQLDIWVSPEIS